jgi:hypothetical protein
LNVVHTYDALAHTFVVKATVENISQANLLAPIRIAVINVAPASFSLDDPSGNTDAGLPYLAIPVVGGVLEPGQTATVELHFSDASSGRAQAAMNRPAKGRTGKNSPPRHFDVELSMLASLPVTVASLESTPGALQAGTGESAVTFVARVLPEDSLLDVRLRRVDVSAPAVDLSDGGDGVHSAEIILDAGASANGPASRGCFAFEAFAEFAGAEIISPVHQLCLSAFPVGIAPSDVEADNVVAGFDGLQAIADEVSVEVHPGAGESQVASLASSIGGTVVGFNPDTNTYQLKLDATLSPAELEALVEQIQQDAIVADALPSTLGGAAAPLVSIPDDTCYAPSIGPEQDQLQIANPEIAWVFGTGAGQVLATVDSGSDFCHEDLRAQYQQDAGGNVIALNCVSGSGCPDASFPASTCDSPSPSTGGATDQAGHGTIVTGVAAADSDNALGVAGAAWDAKVLTVRVLDGSLTASVNKMVEAINAARLKAPDVMNLSFGLALDMSNSIHRALASNLCNEVRKATDDGIIVVAASGNTTALNASYGCTASRPRFYPGACNENTGIQSAKRVAQKQRLIVVATHDSNDVVDESITCTGSYVDVAAPATGVLSTSTTGDGTAACGSAGVSYVSSTGSSFAAPMVAGGVASMLSKPDAAGTTAAEELDAIEPALKATGEPLTLSGGGVPSYGGVNLGGAMLWLNLAPTASAVSAQTIAEDGSRQPGRAADEQELRQRGPGGCRGNHSRRRRCEPYCPGHADRRSGRFCHHHGGGE